jgi:hypothetical protein
MRILLDEPGCRISQSGRFPALTRVEEDGRDRARKPVAALRSVRRRRA